jgi:16S rRNA (adenine1518-N6/adenine1519-N6)-dimethyltransferase
MNLLQRAKYLLRVHNISPKKRLGQNFMINDHYLRLLCSYAELKGSDIVLEIGAGLGFLTQMLAQKAKKVTAVEFDPQLTRILRGELAEFHNVDLVEGDILKMTAPPFDKIVANPPFSISSPILFWLLKKNFDKTVLTLQKEYAMRLNAPVGSREYSRLTVSVYRHANAELLDIVPKEAFYPSPHIDVQVVGLVLHKKPPFEIKDEEIFDTVVRLLFTQRNRKVQTAVKKVFHGRILGDIDKAGRPISTSLLAKRVRELTPQDFEMLANELAA